MKKFTLSIALTTLLLGIVISITHQQLLATYQQLFFPRYQKEKDTKEFFDAHYETHYRDTFVFDPQHRVWAVYNKAGHLVGSGHASGGKDFCPDVGKPCRTVEGSFTVFRTEDKDCTSKTFPIDEGGGAPMPHCMFFHKGYAIHGSNAIPSENASHGCIRIAKSAAKWMNKNYIKEGAVVVVLPYDDSAQA